MKKVFITQTGTKYSVDATTKDVTREGGLMFHAKTGQPMQMNGYVGKLQGNLDDYKEGSSLLIVDPSGPNGNVISTSSVAAIEIQYTPEEARMLYGDKLLTPEMSPQYQHELSGQDLDANTQIVAETEMQLSQAELDYIDEHSLSGMELDSASTIEADFDDADIGDVEFDM